MYTPIGRSFITDTGTNSSQSSPDSVSFADDEWRRNVTSMSPISDDPSKRLGIYKQFEDIPAEHRLEAYRDQYRGRDTWGEFLTQVFLPQHNSYQTQQEARRLTHKWQTVVSEAGRHHTLARPRDLERWLTTALKEVNPSTAYRAY